MDKLKKIFSWISTHTKICFLVIIIILFSVLVLWWGYKNRKIKALENQLAILNAKLKIEKLVLTYNTQVAELVKLREQDKKVNEDIVKIEASLETKLTPDMTAEQIADIFRKLGVRP
jgi:hypothetical protein